jgi:hypothetical protein
LIWFGEVDYVDRADACAVHGNISGGIDMHHATGNGDRSPSSAQDFVSVNRRQPAVFISLKIPLPGIFSPLGSLYSKKPSPSMAKWKTLPVCLIGPIV